MLTIVIQTYKPTKRRIKMFKNYIFDFGQVIVHFDTAYMTSMYIKNNEMQKRAESVIFDRLYWDRLDAGTITDEEVKEEIRNRLPENISQNACDVYDNWYRNLPFIDGMVDIIKKIKKTGGKLFLLSNISIGFAENYKDVPELKGLFDLFDGLVFSGPIGLVKPNACIFNHLLQKYKLKAEECIFIDDNKNNISGAENVGITGYLFDGDADALSRKIFAKKEDES